MKTGLMQSMAHNFKMILIIDNGTWTSMSQTYQRLTQEFDISRLYWNANAALYENKTVYNTVENNYSLLGNVPKTRDLFLISFDPSPL